MIQLSLIHIYLAVRNQLLKNGYREGSMLLMVDNNMSVVYLDLGRPEEAIPYLTEALELTKENGLVGSAVAEPTWNLARVYRALGDEEKEDIYLKAAVEGFRECYPQMCIRDRSIKAAEGKWLAEVFSPILQEKAGQEAIHFRQM